MVKQGNDERSKVVDDYTREPFLIVQRGLEKSMPVRFLSGIFYDVLGDAFDCEIVSIPKYSDKGEVINRQSLRPSSNS